MTLVFVCSFLPSCLLLLFPSFLPSFLLPSLLLSSSSRLQMPRRSRLCACTGRARTHAAPPWRRLAPFPTRAAAAHRIFDNEHKEHGHHAAAWRAGGCRRMHRPPAMAAEAACTRHGGRPRGARLPSPYRSRPWEKKKKTTTTTKKS